MKRSVIVLVIVLMSAALAGIVIMQTVHIRQQVTLKEKQFDANVMEALRDVASVLENREAARMIAWNSARSSRDSTISAAFLSLDTLKRNLKKIKIPELNFSSPRFEYYFRFNEDTVIYPDAHRISKSFAEDWGRKLELLHEFHHGDADEQLKDMEVRVKNKEKQLEVVIKKMVHEAASLNDSSALRFEKAQLEKTIGHVFKNRGISVPYSYAVIDAENDSVLVTNHSAASSGAAESPYVAELFPNDIVPQHHLLSVWFSEKPSFLFSGSNTSLLGSFVFIFIVIICFGYTLLTLIRQKKLSDMKSDFINNMTHELKTPIATISVAADALRDTAPAANEMQIKYYSGIIRQENQRMNAQVERVLQLARLDKKEMQLNKETVNIHELIHHAAAPFRMQIEKSNGILTEELASEHPVIQADPLHVSNVIHNLLDNARKYSPQKPDIVIKTWNDAKGIFLSVTDHGMGMNKETLKKIFDKFYRALHGDIHEVKGFGIGLSYVKEIVELHEGRISVESQPENGSTFTVFLPNE